MLVSIRVKAKQNIYLGRFYKQKFRHLQLSQVLLFATEAEFNFKIIQRNFGAQGNINFNAITFIFWTFILKVDQFIYLVKIYLTLII